MAPTQFDMIRGQTEAAVRNEINRGVSAARRDTSPVDKAMNLLGGAAREGERALHAGRKGAPHRDPGVNVVPTEPAPAPPAPDGYVRRSPVQPLYEAADYRRSLILKAVGFVALAAVVCVAAYFVIQLGLFGR